MVDLKNAEKGLSSIAGMEPEEFVLTLRRSARCAHVNLRCRACTLRFVEAADLIEQQSTRIAEIEDKLQKAIADKEFAERKFDRAEKEFARLRQLDDVRFERLVKENEELRAPRPTAPR